MVSSYEGLSAHLAFVRFLTRVDFHVLPPAAALHEPPPAVLADERTIARVGPHVVAQTLGRAQLLAAFGTLHTGVQTDGLVLRFRVIGLVTHVRTLAPRGFEALPAVGAAQVPSSGDHGHVVPPLAVVLQVFQVLEAAGAGGAGVEAAGGGRGVGFADVDPQVHLRVEGAAADGAGVLREDVKRVAREATLQLGEVLFLMDPLDVLLQEVQVSEGNVAVRTREKFGGGLWEGKKMETQMHY